MMRPHMWSNRPIPTANNPMQTMGNRQSYANMKLFLTKVQLLNLQRLPSESNLLNANVETKKTRSLNPKNVDVEKMKDTPYVKIGVREHLNHLTNTIRAERTSFDFSSGYTSVGKHPDKRQSRRLQNMPLPKETVSNSLLTSQKKRLQSQHTEKTATLLKTKEEKRMDREKNEHRLLGRILSEDTSTKKAMTYVPGLDCVKSVVEDPKTCETNFDQTVIPSLVTKKYTTAKNSYDDTILGADQDLKYDTYNEEGKKIISGMMFRYEIDTCSLTLSQGSNTYNKNLYYTLPDENNVFYAYSKVISEGDQSGSQYIMTYHEPTAINISNINSVYNAMGASERAVIVRNASEQDTLQVFNIDHLPEGVTYDDTKNVLTVSETYMLEASYRNMPQHEPIVLSTADFNFNPTITVVSDEALGRGTILDCNIDKIQDVVASGGSKFYKVKRTEDIYVKDNDTDSSLYQVYQLVKNDDSLVLEQLDVLEALPQGEEAETVDVKTVVAISSSVFLCLVVVGGLLCCYFKKADAEDLPSQENGAVEYNGTVEYVMTDQV